MPLRKMQGDIYRVGQGTAAVECGLVSEQAERGGGQVDVSPSLLDNNFSHSIVSSKSFLGCHGIPGVGWKIGNVIPTMCQSTVLKCEASGNLGRKT